MVITGGSHDFTTFLEYSARNTDQLQIEDQSTSSISGNKPTTIQGGVERMGGALRTGPFSGRRSPN